MKKDTQQDPDFVVVARVESFVAGLGVEEALRRAEAYQEAGADAIVVHSKKSDASEIENFMKYWTGNCPIIAIPTKYYKTPTDTFRDLNIRLLIWANHTLRSAILAMENLTKQIFLEQSVQHVESKIATIKEIFAYQDLDELKRSEDFYLPRASVQV